VIGQFVAFPAVARTCDKRVFGMYAHGSKDDEWHSNLSEEAQRWSTKKKKLSDQGMYHSAIVYTLPKVYEISGVL